ncbi:MAG: hypothetical protein AAF628_10575 [Planctomycetota bacterium]
MTCFCAEVSLPIPGDPALAGLRFFAQSMGFDPTGEWTATTRGVDIGIGWR